MHAAHCCPLTGHRADIPHVLVTPACVTNCNPLITVDAAEAGEGNLEILVSTETGDNIPTRVEPAGGAVFRVSFVPRSPERHGVAVTFNDEQVPGKYY